MIEPTLGRIVWFTAAKEHEDTVPGNDGRCAAIVTYVHHSRLVNLTVFDASGKPVPKTGVRLLQDQDAPPDGGYFCQWMPYQLEAAGRHATPQGVFESRSDAPLRERSGART